MYPNPHQVITNQMIHNAFFGFPNAMKIIFSAIVAYQLPAPLSPSSFKTADNSHFYNGAYPGFQKEKKVLMSNISAILDTTPPTPRSSYVESIKYCAAGGEEERESDRRKSN